MRGSWSLPPGGYFKLGGHQVGKLHGTQSPRQLWSWNRRAPHNSRNKVSGVEEGSVNGDLHYHPHLPIVAGKRFTDDSWILSYISPGIK